MKREVNYVTFYSPGTLFNEETTKPIDSWSIPTALKMSDGITERHAAKPFGFRFKTMEEFDPIDKDGVTFKADPIEKESSGIHYINGHLKFYSEIPDDRENRILKSNMRNNDYPAIIETCNSYRHTAPFRENDCNIVEGHVMLRASDPEVIERMNTEREAWLSYHERNWELE